MAEHLVVTLFDLIFKPSKTDAIIWMRKKGDQYEYVVSFVDPLICALHDAIAPMKGKLRNTTASKVLGVQFTLWEQI